MSGIKRRSRVSTEAWRFDTKNVANEHRWLQWVDGENGWMGNGENGWIHEHMGQLFLDQGINGLYVGMLMMKKYRWNVITFKKKRDDLPLQSEEIFILFRKQCYLQKCMQETCFLIHL